MSKDQSAMSDIAARAEAAARSSSAGLAPAGSRDPLGSSFLCAVQADFAQHGVGVLARIREEKPETYLKLVSSIPAEGSECRNRLRGRAVRRTAHRAHPGPGCGDPALNLRQEEGRRHAEAPAARKGIASMGRRHPCRNRRFAAREDDDGKEQNAGKGNERRDGDDRLHRSIA